MAIDVDLFAIKQRIVDILDSNSTLFDATGASGKVRKIEAGAPRMKENLIVETTIPHIWVTNDTIIDDITVENVVQGNAPTFTKHNISLRILLLTQKKDGFKVEEVLDDFVKLINEEITENYDLRQPGGAESTSVADSCIVRRVTEMSGQMTGTYRQGRIISLKCLVTTG